MFGIISDMEGERVTVEMPHGRPAQSWTTSRFDGHRGETRWSLALCELEASLRRSGVETMLNGQIGAVDAILRDAASQRPIRRQRTVLRPHRGRLWWWLRVPSDELKAPSMTPLAPAAEPAVAARRIHGLLTAPQR
ncbi:hypothetical protein JCM3263A_30250 [Thermobifida fusca]